MKIFIPVIIFYLTTSPANAQDTKGTVLVDNVNINAQPDVHYIEILAYNAFMSTKITVAVWYGQQIKLGDDQRIQGSDGKNIKFNNNIDALNFLYKNGWEFVNAYIVSAGNQNVYHYILKRKE